MELHPDWKEFIESFNRHEVDYVVIAAFALAFHGLPRLKGDIDFLVRPDETNALRVLRALDDFGFGSLKLKVEDFTKTGQFVQLGVAPYRIDVSTGITDVTFEEVWETRVPGEIGGLPVSFISKELYLRNKEATGREKDRLDVALLRDILTKDLPE